MLNRFTAEPRPGQPHLAPGLAVPVVFEATATRQPRWEYRVVTCDPWEEAPLDGARLNALGADGWLLVGTAQAPAGRAGVQQLHYYFVREGGNH